MNILEGTHNPRPGDEVTIREVDGIFAVEGMIDYKEFKGKLFVYQTEDGEFNGWDWTPERGVDLNEDAEALQVVLDCLDG